MIKNIEISKLKPHPNNPRKAIGNISELADSIKRNGVFQNLTVVPNEDDTYTIIIGHRRHAAAKKAGLKELPCAVVEMTEKEQLSTMLLENMQREDLTILEQAEGFQMMIDLGESVKSISEQTGFSQSTVRHRVKLLELDKKELKKQENMNVSITDYIKLEKIKSPERRNEVLKKIGTNNFEYFVERALQAEIEEEREEKIVEKLKALNAIDISNEKNTYPKYGPSIISGRISVSNVDDLIIPEEYADRQLFYKIQYGLFYIYIERNAEEAKGAMPENGAERIRRETYNKLIIIDENFKKIREEWMIDRYISKPEHLPIIMSLLFYLNSIGKCCWLDISAFKWLDIGSTVTLDDMPVVKDVGQALLRIIYDTVDFDKTKPFDYYCCYCSNTNDVKALVSLYEVIQKLGYTPADEEIEYINGTHKLYANENSERAN